MSLLLTVRKAPLHCLCFRIQGIVEYDTVDLSNLHRQIGHRESSVGSSKARSLVDTLKTLNSSINYTTFETALATDNAKEIVSEYVADRSVLP